MPDRLAVKRKLYAGLGDFARRMRVEEMRKKYSTGKPALDDVMASSDEAIDAAHMPDMGGKKADLTITIAPGGNSKLGGEEDFESGMSDMADDEEMKKRMMMGGEK